VIAGKPKVMRRGGGYGGHGAVNGLAEYHVLGLAREERGHVAVFAHAEENQIEHRLRLAVQGCGAGTG